MVAMPLYMLHPESDHGKPIAQWIEGLLMWCHAEQLWSILN